MLQIEFEDQTLLLLLIPKDFKKITLAFLFLRCVGKPVFFFGRVLLVLGHLFEDVLAVVVPLSVEQVEVLQRPFLSLQVLD